MEKGHIREMSKFSDVVVDLPEVLECYSITGDYDFVIKVIARDLRSLSQFLMEQADAAAGRGQRAFQRVPGRVQVHQHLAFAGMTPPRPHLPLQQGRGRWRTQGSTMAR